MHSPEISAGISVQYRTEIIDAATGSVESVKESRNLFLDSGLERLATETRLRENLQYVVLGTGTKPTRRDSGTITASQSGYAVTASASFFEAADVGRLLKFDSGAEVYITGFDSATAVTVASPAEIAAEECTVWHVNDVAHEAEFLRQYFQEDVSANLAGDTYTITRRATTSAFASLKVIKEIGWSWDPNPATPLLGRDLIAGGGDYVAAGKQYRVTVSFSVKYGPAEIVQQVDIGNNGFSTAGEYALEAIGNMPNSGLVYIGTSTTSTPLAPLAGGTAVTGLIVGKEASRVQYVPGSRRAEWVVTIPIQEGNSTDIRSIHFGFPGAYGQSNNIRLLLNAPQTKDSMHTLKIGFAVTLSRFLVN